MTATAGRWPGRRAVEELDDAARSFDAFYRREFADVVGLAYVLSGSSAVAEDLAQEAFVAAHKRWKEIAAYDDPGAWVRKVVSNMSVSVVRRRLAETKAMLRFRAQQASPITFIPAEDKELWAAVRALPRNQAQAIALHYYAGWSLAEIGEALGCSEGTVKTHLHRGRRTLAAKLELDPEEGSG